MSDQPEALFLADVIENDPQSKAHHDAAAACLRRLHAECDALRAALQFIADHDLRGTDLIVAGHIAHALIGKARAALKELK